MFNWRNGITKHVNMIFYEYFSLFHSVLLHILILPSYEIFFWPVVNVIIYCVGAGISTLVSFSDGLDPYIFRGKLEKMRSLNKKWIERCLFPARVGIFLLYLLRLKYVSLLSTLTWRVNIFLSCQGKCINRRFESTKERSWKSLWLSIDCTDFD